MSKIRPPRMRMARKIKKGDVIKIKVKFNHPSFTGLGRADPDNEPAFNRAKPVTFIRNMFVYYDDELVTRFRMSSGIADDPLFTFKLKADKEAPVKVVFVDNNGASLANAIAPPAATNRIISIVAILKVSGIPNVSAANAPATPMTVCIPSLNSK